MPLPTADFLDYDGATRLVDKILAHWSRRGASSGSTLKVWVVEEQLLSRLGGQIFTVRSNMVNGFPP